jgi:hypothetical protein
MLFDKTPKISIGAINKTCNEQSFLVDVRGNPISTENGSKFFPMDNINYVCVVILLDDGKKASIYLEKQQNVTLLVRLEGE